MKHAILYTFPADAKVEPRQQYVVGFHTDPSPSGPDFPGVANFHTSRHAHRALVATPKDIIRAAMIAAIHGGTTETVSL